MYAAPVRRHPDEAYPMVGMDILLSDELDARPDKTTQRYRILDYVARRCHFKRSRPAAIRLYEQLCNRSQSPIESEAK